MKPYTVGFIFARGGSQGVPRKNIRLLAGKPLIAHSIESALECDFIDRVVVSTDDQEIAEIAKQFGADVPFMRPEKLARHDSPEWLAWQHGIQTLNRMDEKKNIELFVSVPPTAPLRSVQDLDNAIQMFMTTECDLVLTAKEAARHPSFNMVALDKQNYATLLMPLEKKIIRRQDAPKAYDITTVAYVAAPDFILNASAAFDGRVCISIVPEERALDIDTELDFRFAEFLLRKKCEEKNENH